MKRRTFLRSTAAAAVLAGLPGRAYPMVRARGPAWRLPQELEAVTGDGRRVVLSRSSISDLAARLRGPVLLAGDEGYDAARTILNPTFDKRPALVVQPTGSADVRTAVDFARDNGGLLLAVKCGGHSHSGKSTCDAGMLIDLSRFRDVRVDPVARTARVTGGSLLGALDHESMAHDLVTPMGTVSHTGVGGLVTGGGFGRVARHFGLSIDNLLSADVVTADGRLHRTGPGENEDLFWGIRGGGGNFGIVTSFEFRLHPMPRQVVAGAVLYPIARAREVLEAWAEYAPVAPDELQMDLVMSLPPGGAPGVAGVAVCWSGDAAGVDRALAPIRSLRSPIADSVAPTDYVALQRSGDVDDPRATGSYTKSGFIAALDPALVAAIVDGFEGHPDRSTTMFCQHSGGAIGRVDPAATAFSQRDIIGNLLCFVGWPFGGAELAGHIDWIRQFWTRIEPHTHGFYVNDLELDMSQARVRDNYRSNHDRLVRVKDQYDPGNLFRLNANVLPSGAAARQGQGEGQGQGQG